MVLLLSEADVTRSLSMTDAVRVVEEPFAAHASGGHVVMPRISADVPGRGGAFRVMSAMWPELGTRIELDGIVPQPAVVS